MIEMFDSHIMFFFFALKAFIRVPVKKSPSCARSRQRLTQISVLCDNSCVRVYVRLDNSDLRPYR